MIEFTMYHSGKTGESKNTYYKNTVVIRNAEDLMNVCRYDHVCAEFKNSHRCNDDFIRCHAIAADCDNDNAEDPDTWLSPLKVSERLPDVQFYYCKSRNCDKVKHPSEANEHSARPRYHYYFPLQYPINDISLARKIMDRFLFLFPEFDKDGTKPAQFFFGHAAPEAGEIDGELDIASYFTKHPEIKEPEPEKTTPIESSSAPSAAAVSDDDFFLLNIEDALQYVSPDDYGDWIKVGQGLFAAERKHNTDCYSIWDKWSSSSGKYKGEQETRRKWASFKETGTDRTADERTIFNMAKDAGWKAAKLTGEYKKAHEERLQREREAQEIQDALRENDIAKIDALGIKYSNPKSLSWAFDFDGNIIKVIDNKTGEILYPTSEDGADPEQPIPGETVHTVTNAIKTAKKKDYITVNNYDDVEIKPTNYLFFPWFPRGKVNAVQGDSGSGKSTFMYAVGAKVTTGEDLLGSPCDDPGNVMFITIEDDASDIKTAFQDSGGDLSKLLRIPDREQIAKMDLSQDNIDVINSIIKNKNIKLLVLDPIQQFLSGDMNKANETRPQLSRLVNIAEENDICIVFLEHMGKDTSKSSLHRGIGSVDIGATTRSIMQIVTDPEDDNYKIAFTVKNNTADLHDVQRAIRYQIQDHPNSYDPETGKRIHYHGHAEFIETLEYNERLYRKARKKAEEKEDEVEEVLLNINYDKDPFVITARELIAENPNGLFISTDDFIQRITECCGHCPYTQTADKSTGIYNRLEKLRVLLLDRDGIQVDKPGDGKIAKAYNWQSRIIEPESKRRLRGLVFNVVKAKQEGFQQTII